jgi:hypothetical protein
MTVSSIEYDSFENPMHTYYGANSEAAVPAFYTGGYQIRQFGVGGASTLGQPPLILDALDPAQETNCNMAAAADNVYLGGSEVVTANNGVDYPVTTNDKNRYFPAP